MRDQRADAEVHRVIGDKLRYRLEICRESGKDPGPDVVLPPAWHAKDDV